MKAWRDWRESILPTALLSSAVILSAYLYRTRLRRLPTANHVTPNWFGRRSIWGKVTSVGDADNFRVFHTPGGRWLGWEWLRAVPTEKKALKDATVHVRIAGVDAPEMAHFSKPAQPFSQEAYDWLHSYVMDRHVRVYLYSRDRFERVVGSVKVWRYLIPRDVGYQMIKRGLATVYEAKTGAQYGGREEQYRRAQAKAKAAKRGMWSARGFFETPREYKTRTRS